MVASPGPPPVMMAMMSNAWKVPITVVIAMKNVTGDSSGNVILRNNVHAPAPSIFAASSRSARHALQSGQVDHRDEADVLPQVDDDEPRQRPGGVGHPGRRVKPNGSITALIRP